MIIALANLTLQIEKECSRKTIMAYFAVLKKNLLCFTKVQENWLI